MLLVIRPTLRATSLKVPPLMPSRLNSRAAPSRMASRFSRKRGVPAVTAGAVVTEVTGSSPRTVRKRSCACRCGHRLADLVAALRRAAVGHDLAFAIAHRVELFEQ